MPRAIVIDLTSLSDSSDDGGKRAEASDTRTAQRHTRENAHSEPTHPPSGQGHLRPLLPASSLTSSRTLSGSQEDNTHCTALDPTPFPLLPEQDHSWRQKKDGYSRHLTQRMGEVEGQLSSHNRSWRKRKADVTTKNRGQIRGVQDDPANRYSAASAARLSGKQHSTLSEKRRSNLIDDLLLSDNGNGSRAIAETPPLTKPLAASSTATTQSMMPLIHFRDLGRLPSISKLNDEVSSTSTIRSPKRVRLEDLIAIETSSQDARAAPDHGRRQPAPMALQTESVGRRRGRPPGSRNKDKLLTMQPKSGPLRGRNASPAIGHRSDNAKPLLHYPCSNQTLTRAAVLRHRELGGYLGFSQRNLKTKLRQSFVDQQLSPWRWWEGASKDVITAAWAPDGLRFAVGASTDLDSLNLRYNRNNNLIWGDNERRTLSELADHHIARSRVLVAGNNPEIISTYNTLDPRVFTTVSSICFSAQNDRMYTGSYDNTVKVWNIGEGDGLPACSATLEHKGRVELLSECQDKSSHVLATAQSDPKHAISIFGLQSDDPESLVPKNNFTSERADRMGFVPTALRWGTIPSWTEHLLLIGFSTVSSDGDRDRQGDLLLWDAARTAPSVRLLPAAQCVFDLAWHPRLALVAAATTPGPMLSSRKTKSVIRTWSPLESGSRIMELECPALDVNEICFHPTDSNYAGAACTDGCAYLWDVRRPDDILQVLHHDIGIEEIDQDRAREAQDTGMRFISWNLDGTVLYTGSSDGVIKQWNPFVAQEDSLIRDVAAFDSGIMTGAFSPDHANLLLGLCKGSVEMLSSAPPSGSGETDAQFTFKPASFAHALASDG